MAEFTTPTSEDTLRPQWEKVLVIGFILFLPTFLFAAGSAMLTTAGHVMVNGSDSPSFSAVFIDDVIATASDSASTINAQGSMVLVQPNSSVQFKGNSVDMGNGDVLVTTSKGMAVKVGKFTISPVAAQSSKFEVSHAAGMIVISARQGSLNISDGKSSEVLPEGQQMTHSDSDQISAKNRPPASATSAVHMSRTAALAIGGVIAGGATAAILLTQTGSSHQLSNVQP